MELPVDQLQSMQLVSPQLRSSRPHDARTAASGNRRTTTVRAILAGTGAAAFEVEDRNGRLSSKHVVPTSQQLVKWVRHASALLNAGDQLASREWH